MTEMTPENPYLPVPQDDLLPFAPFVGRQKAFEHLYQQLTDPVKAGITIILGRQHVGKTALLQHFHPFFDETFVSIYVPLKQMSLDDEAVWLKTLARRTMSALAERGFTLSHLPGEPPAEGDMRDWFGEKFLGEVLNIIRRYRRLVYLIDDADSLIRPVKEGQADEHLLSFLHRMLDHHSHFRVVMTLDAEYEADMSPLSPLVSLTDVFRLTNLSADECLQLLQDPVQSLYTVSPEAAAAIYQAASGQPHLVQRFGHHLFRHYQAIPNFSVVTPDTVKQITPAVYAESEADFRQVWQRLSQNEQLVLRAITELLYHDPLAAISPQAIAAWFVETDFPLDSTAVHATLRSLEYRELVSTTPIQISSGLMQTWMLDNVHRTMPVMKYTARGSLEPLRKNQRRFAAAGIAGLILLVLIVLIILGSPPQPTELPPQPTVTLVTTPTQP